MLPYSFEDVQRERFGARYVGASLAHCEYDAPNQKKIQKWLKTPKGFLVMHGAPGTSKTYFLASLVPWLYSLVNGRSIKSEELEEGPAKVRHPDFRYYTESDFLSHLRRQIGSHGPAEYADVIKNMAATAVFLLDDLGTGQGTAWQEEVIFTLIDQRYNSLLPTIVTTNLSPDQIADRYHSRIYDRLFAHDGVVVALQGPSYRKPNANPYG